MATLPSQDWYSQLLKAKKSCIIDGNFKKIHYDFGDGKEMVEEYNLETQVVNRRAWRYRTLKDESVWEVEIGDPEPSFNEGTLLIKEDSSQPIVSRRITKRNLEWRIRNLPYSLDNYSVTADPDNKTLVVRTKNKKYYKVISMPDLERLGLVPVQKNITFSHKFNTLVISYGKPMELVNMEKALWKELELVLPKNFADDLGDNCKTS